MGEQAMLDKRSAAMAAKYRANGWWRDRTLVDDFLDASAEPARPGRGRHLPQGPSRARDGHLRQLRRYVDRFAGGLLELGVQPGDVVSMQLPNGWEFVALSLACARVGAVVNPLVPIFRHRELTFILERTQARICVVPATFRGFAHGELLGQLARELPTLEHAFVLGALPEGGDLPTGAAASNSTSSSGAGRTGPTSRAELDRRRPGGDDLAEIQFTSGTTGEPKGVQHTWNTAWSAARSFPEILHFGPDDVAFMASTVAHQTGFLYGFVAPDDAGPEGCLPGDLGPAAFVRIVEDEGVTYTVGATPFVMDAVIAHGGRPPPSLDTFRWFCCGGAPIPPHLVAAAHEVLDAQLVAVWGMTENGVVTSTRPDDPVETVANSDGVAVEWMQVRIVGQDDRTARPASWSRPGRAPAGPGRLPDRRLLPTTRPRTRPACTPPRTGARTGSTPATWRGGAPRTAASASPGGPRTW